MADDRKADDQKAEELTPEEKREAQRGSALHPPKVKIPSKFCPYCGYRNDAANDVCDNCGKDISWIKVPEPRPDSTETPYKAPQPLPKQRELTRRMILIIFLVLGLLVVIALLVALFATGKMKSAEMVMFGMTSTGALVAAFPYSRGRRRRRPHRP